MINLLNNLTPTIPIFLGLGTTLTLLYNYYSSDKFVQDFFASKGEVALYSLFSVLSQFFLSSILAIIFLGYALQSGNTSIEEFWSIMTISRQSIIISISTFKGISLMFLIIIIFLTSLITAIFPTKAPSKTRGFYILSNDLRLKNIPTNQKLYFSNIIDKYTFLFSYELNGQSIRILLDPEILRNINIYYEQPASLKTEIKNFYSDGGNIFRKSVLVSSTLVFLLFSGVAFLLNDMTIIFPTTISITILVVLAYLPVIIQINATL